MFKFSTALIMMIQVFCTDTFSMNVADFPHLFEEMLGTLRATKHHVVEAWRVRGFKVDTGWNSLVMFTLCWILPQCYLSELVIKFGGLLKHSRSEEDKNSCFSAENQSQARSWQSHIEPYIYVFGRDWSIAIKFLAFLALVFGRSQLQI